METHSLHSIQRVAEKQLMRMNFRHDFRRWINFHFYTIKTASSISIHLPRRKPLSLPQTLALRRNWPMKPLPHLAKVLPNLAHPCDHILLLQPFTSTP